jgi:hypothetical protein
MQFSHDGSLLATTGGYSTMTGLFSVETGKLLWQRFASTGRDSYGWNHYGPSWVVAGSLTFAPAGDEVYLLTRGSGQPLQLFRSAVAPTTPKLTLNLASRYAGKGTATVVLPGVTSGSVSLRFEHANDWGYSVGTAKVGTNGLASYTFSGQNSPGKMEAAYLGSPTHFPALATATYKVATKVYLGMGGASSTKDGVLQYSSYKKVRATVTLRPIEAGQTIYVGLWKWDSKKKTWVGIGMNKMKTDDTGELPVVFHNRVSGRLMFTAEFPGNSRYAPSFVSGKPFTMK